jgi:hypothetical protein
MKLEYWANEPRSATKWEWFEPACRAIVWTTLSIIAVALLELVLAGHPKFDRHGDAKNSAAKADISNLTTALEEYKIDFGSYPSTDQGLDALVEQPVGVGGWQRA